MQPSSAEFAHLYRKVTESLAPFARTSASPAVAEWFTALMEAFWDQYDEWPGNDKNIESYLLKLESKRVPCLVRLSGHVFLHIAYDLPRSIAASLASGAGGLEGTNSAAVFGKVRQLASRPAGRTLFLEAGPVFAQVVESAEGIGALRSCSRTSELLVRFMRRVSPGMSAFRLIAHWVLSLRSVAWIHAEILADSTDYDRRTLVDRLAAGVNQGLARALEERWLLGVPYLSVPSLPQLLPPVPLVGEHPAATAVIAATLACSWYGAAYWKSLRLIDLIGRSIFDSLNQEWREAPSRPEMTNR